MLKGLFVLVTAGLSASCGPDSGPAKEGEIEVLCAAGLRLPCALTGVTLYATAASQLYVRLIRSGEPLNNGAFMARSTLITVMGQLSCYTGKEVTWEQASASNF